MNSRTSLRSYSGPVSSQATGMETGCPIVVAAVELGQSGRPSGAQSAFVWMSAPVASGISKELEPSAARQLQPGREAQEAVRLVRLDAPSVDDVTDGTVIRVAPWAGAAVSSASLMAGVGESG